MLNELHQVTLEWKQGIFNTLNEIWYEKTFHILLTDSNAWYGTFSDFMAEAVPRRCSVKKMFLQISQNSQENTCTIEPQVCNFIKKETLAQVFSCEFCKISKNIFLQSTSGGCSVYGSIF